MQKIDTNYESHLINLARNIEAIESAQNVLYVSSILSDVEAIRGYGTPLIYNLFVLPNWYRLLNILKHISLVALEDSNEQKVIKLIQSPEYIMHTDTISGISSKLEVIPSTNSYMGGIWKFDGNIRTLPNQLKATYSTDVNNVIVALKWMFSEFKSAYDSKQICCNEIQSHSIQSIADFIWSYVKGNAVCHIPKSKIFNDVNHALIQDEILYTCELRNSNGLLFTGFEGFYHELCNDNNNPIMSYIDTDNKKPIM